MPSYLAIWLSEELGEPFTKEELPKTGKSHTGAEYNIYELGGDVYVQVVTHRGTAELSVRLASTNSVYNYDHSGKMEPITHGSKLYQFVFKQVPSGIKLLPEFSDTPFE